VNPLLVLVGFVASVALVLAIVISSIALYRCTRQRQQLHLPSSAATALMRRKRAKQQDSTAAATGGGAAQRATLAHTGRDVIRLTASCNNTPMPARQPLQTDAVDV